MWARDGDGGLGLHRRRRRTTHLHRRFRFHPGRGGLDDGRLHARVRDRDPDNRVGSRPIRQQTALHHFCSHLHTGLAAVRDGPNDTAAHHVSDGAGRRRGHAGATELCRDNPRGRPEAAGSPGRGGGNSDAARPDRWADPGRLAHRRLRLEVDLPDQRADRVAGDRPGDALLPDRPAGPPRNPSMSLACCCSHPGW